MNILTVENISLTYLDKEIMKDVSFGIDEGEKVGVIGINGTGKSTLLKIIAGEETPDRGQVIKGNHIYIDYLPQNPIFKKDDSVMDHMLKDKTGAEGWDVKAEASILLNKLGISDTEARLSTLSGGQRKRVALAKALITKAGILVLDEPTNHLDNEMNEWLENYLRKYKGAVIMVTHDRYFLDAVADRILEVDHGNVYSYDDNYSGYLELKMQRAEMEQASERKAKAIYRNELAWMMRGCRARTTKQKARIERFKDLKERRRPTSDDEVSLSGVSTRLGKKTIILESISKGFGERRLFSDFSYTFLKRDRIGIVGPNGAGKSTLLKIIADRLQPDSGIIERGTTVKIGYFAQESIYPDNEMRVIDYIREAAEYIAVPEGKISASAMLERFLFTPEKQWTKVGKLSGGEKRRLYLLKVLMEAPNVLILDEPTNNLDIATLMILEDYLDDFSGIVIAVSHDRYFLDRVTDRIFAFEDGEIRQYEGNYSDHIKKAPQKEINIAEKKEQSAKTERRVRQQRFKFTYKEQKEFETIDDDIALLEEKLAKCEDDILKNSRDFVKLNELTKEKERLQAELDEKMDRWVYLNDLAEQIANQ